MSYTPAVWGSSLINQLSVAHGANAAAIVDMTSKTAGMLLCKIVTASNAITTGTTFSLFRLPGQANGTSPNTTINHSGGYSSGATSVVVTSATYIPTKCTLLFISASASPGLGELVTVTGVSSNTLTVNALINSYANSDYVFLMEQSASGGSVAPGTSWAATTDYSTSIYVPSFVQGAGGLWAIVASNGDGSYSVTVTVNLDYCT